MKKYLFLALLFGFMAAHDVFSQDTCPIIPKVASYSLTGDGFATLPPGSSYSIALCGTKEDASAFCSYLESCDLGLVPGSKAHVRFKIGPKAIKGKNADDGSYRIDIGKKGIDIKAPGFTGAFYAVQSLIQLAQDSPQIPWCSIQDQPRYAYRGLMFDVVRHFHSKEFILRQLDLMARLKMNVMHFHLTDNEAWRIQLDCAPEMTREAAFGDSRYFNTILPRFTQEFAQEPAGYVSGTVYDDGTVYGGYYSRDDIKEIIDYAAKLHIDVIPEIEIPGHNRALLHVHPEFYCSGDHSVDNVFCIAREEPFDFFFKVLEEVMELFPSAYMHIGGDEASKANWKLCPLCKEKMKEEGLNDEFELQSYCIRRVDSFVTSHGKRMIGWDEILEGGLSDNATVMSWRGTEGGQKAIRMHHNVIMTPNTYYYLDYGQDSPWKEPAAFNYYVPLKTVYDYEPEDGLENPSLLLGVQANLWSECIITDNHFEYMLYPRAFAVAETGWSPKGSKDYPGFWKRALAMSERIMQEGYGCFDLSTEEGDRPISTVEIPRITRGAKAILHIGSSDGEGMQGGREAPALVDGYLGGWAAKGNTRWVDIRKRTTAIDIDLGEIKEIHYLGAEFIDYMIRNITAPQDTEFFLSEDGVNYVKADIPQLQLSPDRKCYSIITVGAPVCARARYIRLRYNSGNTKVRTHISEVIVN